MAKPNPDEYKKLVEEQGNQLLEVIRALSSDNLDVKIEIPEGVKVFTELANEIKQLRDTLQTRQSEHDETELVRTQSKALLDVIQSVALGDFDVTIDVPEGVEELSELSIGIEMMIDDIRLMLSEQEENQKIIEAALTQTEALYVGSDRVLRSNTVEEVLNALVRSTALQKLKQVEILLFDAPVDIDGVPLTLTTSATWAPHEGEQPAGRKYQFTEIPGHGVMKRSDPLIIPDVASSSKLDKQSREALTKEREAKSFVAWPLEAGEMWLGMILGYASKTVKLDENDQRQITTLADQAAIVIQGIRLYEQAQIALAEAEATHQLYLQKRWSEYTTQRQQDLLYDPSTDEKEPSSSRHTRQAYETFDVPIAIRGQAVGKLAVDITDRRSPLTSEQKILVDTITQQMGLALENLRLIEETQRSAAREQLLREITSQIRETLDIETVLKTAAKEIGTSLGLAAINIQLGTSTEENG